MITIADTPCFRSLHCREVWGGLDDADEALDAAGLCASLYSRSYSGGRGGDVYYLSVCDAGLLARVVIADVVGHGHHVAEVSRWIYETMAARLNDHDDASVLDELNRLAVERGYDAVTTAVVASCCQGDPMVSITYAGHPPVMLQHGSRVHTIAPPDLGRWINLPLGVSAETTYRAVTLPMAAGDRLFLYTDGLIEARARDGRQFSGQRLAGVLDTLSSASVDGLKRGVVEALDAYTASDGPDDDVTFLAIERV